jgi:hypothetical protein
MKGMKNNMFKSLRNTIVSLLSVVTLLVVPLAVPALASAESPNIQDSVCGAANSLQVNDAGNCTATSTGTDKINGFITTIVNVFSIIVGVVAVIMIIVGGFRYITSGGDSNNISSAKNTIIYAIIGLIIVALAQFIVQFVLNKVTQ